MELSGKEQEKLVNAIVSAYPNKYDLEMMVQFELEESLEAIAGGENLQDIVFKLLTRWAIPRGKLEKLIQACCSQNPDNPDLNEFYQKTDLYKYEKLIDILQRHFNQERNEILNAYELSLPNRLIDKKIPQNEKEVISGLLLPQEQEVYSYVQKFVCYLLSNKKTSIPFKQKLQEWAKENIDECNQLIEKLIQEQIKREQQCNPCLIIAISGSGDNYIIEGWFIKNLYQYHRESFSDCEKLQIDNQGQKTMNKSLENLPQLIRKFIYQCSANIKQIHIFLPLELMNYAVDCWTTYEDEEETIGEIYEVFIRCSEGLRGKNPRLMAWREKGKLLQEKLSQPAADIFTLGDSKEIKTLEKTLKQKNAIAVKIISVFQNKLPGEILWKAAVPLALWVRQELPDIDNLVILDELINGGSLEELPERVKLKRLDAMDNQTPENHVGRHLCLLWDDPDLLPPEQQLTESKL